MLFRSAVFQADVQMGRLSEKLSEVEAAANAEGAMAEEMQTMRLLLRNQSDNASVEVKRAVERQKSADRYRIDDLDEEVRLRKFEVSKLEAERNDREERIKELRMEVQRRSENERIYLERLEDGKTDLSETTKVIAKQSHIISELEEKCRKHAEEREDIKREIAETSRGRGQGAKPETSQIEANYQQLVESLLIERDQLRGAEIGRAHV